MTKAASAARPFLRGRALIKIFERNAWVQSGEIDANIKLLKDDLDNVAERMKKAVHMSALLFVGVLLRDGVSPICVDGDRYNPDCKLKEASKYLQDFDQVDKIEIDTTEKSFTLHATNAQPRAPEKVWPFYENWSGDGCSHMTFSENTERHEISGAETWTCASSGVHAFIYNRESKTFVFVTTMAALSETLRWQCTE
jgi:hypothetical protein